MILEVLDGRGRVLHRHRLTTLPATVGRAYDCDVIIDDPYVDPHHLTVTAGPDASVATDLGSANGTWRHGARIDHITIESGTEIRAGRTVLRFLDPAHPVPAALTDRRGGSRIARYFTEPKTGLVIIAASMAIFGLSKFLESIIQTKFATIAAAIVATLLLASIWAGAWALATRVVSGRFRFTSHLAWVSACSIGFMVASSVGQWLGFLFPGFGGLAAVQLVTMTALLSCLIAGHLWLATEMSSRRRWRVAITASLAALAIATLFALTESSDDTSDSLAFARVLKPVSATLVPTSTLDDFLTATKGLRHNVDELAAKALRDEAAAAETKPPRTKQ